MKTNIACGSCDFFHVTCSEIGKGECRINPPVFTPLCNGLFPSVSSCDWCGKFKQGVFDPLNYNILKQEIVEWEFSVRTENGLRRAGIKTVRDLVVMSENEILMIDNIGIKSLNEIKNVAKEYGLTLGMNI